MKKLLPLALASLLALAACSPSVEKLNQQGNESFNQQDYAAALTAYQQAGEKSRVAGAKIRRPALSRAPQCY